MNYYPHHIGDFNNATRHLSRVERSLYRDMLDMYYDTEQPLTADFNLLCRKLMARTEEESTGVQQVLNEFFTESEQGWRHDRCDRVIAEYHAQLEKKSAAGKASAQARAAAKAASEAAQTLGSSTGVEQVLQGRSTNQEPITNNQEPKPSSKTKAAPDGDLFPGVADQVVADFKAMRKTQKAPITQTAIDGIRREAAKAGIDLEAALKLCCERSWRGFKAEWATNSQQQARASPAYQSRQDKAAEWLAKATGTSNDEPYTIDIN